MPFLAKFIALASVAAALAACSHAGRYTGDGQFTDNGWMNYSRRYVIDLGPVNLAAPGMHTFALRGLPHAEFTANIDVVEDADTIVSGDRPTHAVRVRMVVRSSDGELVISEESMLQSWIRSSSNGDGQHARLYSRGESKDVLLPGGGTRSERLGLKASGGWGSYFAADRNESYKLTFEVLTSELSASIPARLTIVGWDRE